MKTINPYLLFNGNAEEAFTLYQTAFGGELEKVRFSDMPGTENLTEEARNKMAHIALPLAGHGHILMASDSMPGSEVNQINNGAFYVCIEPGTRQEAEEIYSILSENGKIAMPLSKSDWAELAAMFTDRFGVQWMINFGD